jgi:hypothetical protein
VQRRFSVAGKRNREGPFIALAEAAIKAGFIDLGYCIFVLAAFVAAFNLTQPGDEAANWLRTGLLYATAVPTVCMAAGCIRISWRMSFPDGISGPVEKLKRRILGRPSA